MLKLALLGVMKMNLKVYLHYNSLIQFANGSPVIARFGFVGQDDVELNIDLSKIVLKRQKGSVIIRKKKFWEKLLFWKDWSVE